MEQLIHVYAPESDDREIHFASVSQQCGVTLCGVNYFTKGLYGSHFDERVEAVETDKSVTCVVCLSIVTELDSPKTSLRLKARTNKKGIHK